MMAESKSWRRGTQRLAVYNDGPWGFLYDAAYAAELADMRAANMLLLVPKLRDYESIRCRMGRGRGDRPLPVLQDDVCVLCLPPGFPAVPHYLAIHGYGDRPLAEPDVVRYTIRLPVRVSHTAGGTKKLCTMRARGNRGAICFQKAAQVSRRRWLRRISARYSRLAHW
jgi:hypothetical protein